MRSRSEIIIIPQNSFVHAGPMCVRQKPILSLGPCACKLNHVTAGGTEHRVVGPRANLVRLIRTARQAMSVCRVDAVARNPVAKQAARIQVGFSDGLPGFQAILWRVLSRLRSLFNGQPKRGHLLSVANQQDVTDQHWVVPGLSFDRRKPCILCELIR